ncbi:hypothetical protein LR48_Vigan393s001900 [Vigna angularis]|uniref:Uncharacterized protein n=1 Tax=Phaseolus angularis TaxID=3914 RepID=A0A0L9T8Y9_PHAAN|nr:hypothetical protein LR48_Vigan393s001900 [Vigna angularis]
MKKVGGGWWRMKKLHDVAQRREENSRFGFVMLVSERLEQRRNHLIRVSRCLMMECLFDIVLGFVLALVLVSARSYTSIYVSINAQYNTSIYDSVSAWYYWVVWCDIRALTRAGSDVGARGMVQGAQIRSDSWQASSGRGTWTNRTYTGMREIWRLSCDIRALTRAGSDAGARGMVQGAQIRSGSWQASSGRGTWTNRTYTGMRGI